jgi:hypothetical protein
LPAPGFVSRQKEKDKKGARKKKRQAVVDLKRQADLPARERGGG